MVNYASYFVINKVYNLILKISNCTAVKESITNND